MEQVASRRVVRRVFSPDLLSPVQVQVEPKKLVVAAYARVSTEKEQQENSYERQVEHYTALIKANDAWEFGGIYADPGISGTRAEKRPEFMRMIADCRAGKIDKILAKSISRFARNTVDTLSYIRELKELGIGVCFENEHIDTLTPGGEVLLTILAAIAEQESRTMSTNIKWTYQKKFQNGEVILSTGTMLGYMKDGDGNYVINEPEAEIVRRVFREYIAGASLTQIRHGLEADGIKTKRGCSNWRANGILGIIKNEKYTGNALLGKTYKPDVLSKRRLKNTGQAPLYYVENTHPAIVSQEVFDIDAFYRDQVGVSSSISMNDGFDARLYFDKNVIRSWRDMLVSETTINGIREFFKSGNNLPEEIAVFPGMIHCFKAIVALAPEQFEQFIAFYTNFVSSDIERVIDSIADLTQKTLKFCCLSETTLS